MRAVEIGTERITNRAASIARTLGKRFKRFRAEPMMLSQFTKPRYFLLFRGFCGYEISQQIPSECTDWIPLLTTSKTSRRSILGRMPAKKLRASESGQIREFGNASFTPKVARWSPPSTTRRGPPCYFSNTRGNAVLRCLLRFLGHHLIGDVQVRADVLDVVVFVDRFEQPDDFSG